MDEALQAAHIDPNDGPATNVTRNGLLLRADLHNLFDANLLWIDLGYVFRVAEHLRGGSYGQFGGQRLRLPADPAQQPDLRALLARRQLGTSAV